MSNYDAIYSATRSALGNPDISGIFREVATRALDISPWTCLLSGEIGTVVSEMARPSVLFRPVLSLDGDKWCAMYGPNIQEGVAAFGSSPDEAMRKFDAAWNKPVATTEVRP